MKNRLPFSQIQLSRLDSVETKENSCLFNRVTRIQSSFRFNRIFSPIILLILIKTRDIRHTSCVSFISTALPFLLKKRSAILPVSTHRLRMFSVWNRNDLVKTAWERTEVKANTRTDRCWKTLFDKLWHNEVKRFQRPRDSFLPVLINSKQVWKVKTKQSLTLMNFEWKKNWWRKREKSSGFIEKRETIQFVLLGNFNEKAKRNEPGAFGAVSMMKHRPFHGEPSIDGENDNDPETRELKPIDRRVKIRKNSRINLRRIKRIGLTFDFRWIVQREEKTEEKKETVAQTQTG